MRTIEPWMIDELEDLDAVANWAESHGWKAQNEGAGDGTFFRSLLEGPDVAPDSVWRP